MAWPRRSKRSKFGNIRTMLDGYRFDSLKEARRYQELRLLEKSGDIRGLCADKKLLRYAIVVNGVFICHYTPDFRYEEHGKLVIEDTKGVKTEAYKLRRLLMAAVHNIHIRET